MVVEVVLNEVRLRAEMFGYSQNVLLLSIFISLITATLLYLALPSRWRCWASTCSAMVCVTPSVRGYGSDGGVGCTSFRSISRRDGAHELQAQIPGKVDPGVLADFGDKRIDHGPTRWFGVDGGEVSLG